MDEAGRDRIQRLAREGPYARERGLMLIPISHRGRDGKLISLGVSPLPDPDLDQNPERSLSFHAGRTVARYLEVHEKPDGRRHGVSYKAPFDFSESYRIGDIWSGTFRGADEDWPKTREFSDPQSFIDFLSERLTSPEHRLSEGES
jgi:hypothetical protein